MIPYDPLKQLHDLNKASPQFHDHLRDFLGGDVYRRALPNLQGEDLTSIVEYLDSVLVGISDRAIPVFQESLHELRKICSLRELLPKSWTLSESLLGCVYKGTFNGSKVRIRRVRAYSGGDLQKVKETFHKVAVISKRSAHPNIVPLLGVMTEPLELISDWMPGGDLPGYIEKHPDADMLSLLSDVAEGLNYLHSCDVIHGDLKGSSILVDATDRARITDFGLAMVTRDPGSVDQSARWIAPEILEGGGAYSKKADIFSFAGVTIEAFTGAVPFSDKPPHEAKSAIERGERPPRPIHPTLTDEIWTMLQRCWGKEAHLRPQALIISCGFNNIPAWKCLIDCPLTPNERISLITDIFSNHEDTEVVRSLDDDDAQSFADVINKTLDSVGSSTRQELLKTLHKKWGHQALLPRSLQIQLCYDRSSEPLCHGGCADVWKVEYQGRMVAVKVLKVSQISNLDRIRRNFFKEVMVWKSLRHPYVLPFLGATINERRFEMVSEWMDNGNINEFIEEHSSENRFELLKDVTSGLIYLHNQPVIHGDLKGANILIDQDRRARLADFGLVSFARDPMNPTSLTTSICGTTRWMSPELLDPEAFGFKDSRPTKESDRYALGMVILEVLSGQFPFVGDRDVVVMRKVACGENPKRPKEAWFTNEVWGILKRCWAPKPRDRPRLEAVLRCLEGTSASWETLSTINLSGREVPDRDGTEPTIRGASSGPDNTQTPLQLDTISTHQWSYDLARKKLDIEDLDKALDNLSPAGFAFKWTHEKLQEVCAFQNLLPSSHVLSSQALNIDEYPFTSSSFSDAYKGVYNGLEICVKKLRIASDTNPEQARKMLLREASMWKRLIHPNVVPFVGVTTRPPQIASEWMPRGNLTTYVNSNPDRDRVHLLVDVAKGLDYIHSHGVIHGDLKGPNILVDGSGHARITDFGLAQSALGVVSKQERQSMRWTAPEVLAETGAPSTEADAFSFGMIVVEAFTGTVPFSDHIPQAAVTAIISGRRPPRPMHSGLTDGLWELMNRCWDQDRHNRPRMLEVLLILNPLIHEISDIRQWLENLDPSNEEYRPLLYALLSHRDLKAYIDNPQKGDLRGFIELLDEALNNIPVTDDLFRKALRRLQNICSNHEVLPHSYLIPGGTLSNRGIPSLSGGSADAHGAELNGKRVCIKALRLDVQSKTFYGGVVVWKRLQHPNIVPFLGISAEMSRFEIVYDWMEHRGITGYVKGHPEVDRVGLLQDVAEGLHYLHLYNIVHGDLKGANVLIDKDGHARLADFGLVSTVLGNQSVVSLSDARLTVATTWAAPEISEGGSVTKAGDVFAFGMMAAETFTERLSIEYYAAVSSGGRPERPATLSEDLWNLMQRCWNEDPGKRPTSFELVDFFRQSFLRERELQTRTFSSTFSDGTLGYNRGGNTGSHSNLSPGGTRMYGNGLRRVPTRPGRSGSPTENVPARDPRLKSLRKSKTYIPRSKTVDLDPRIMRDAKTSRPRSHTQDSRPGITGDLKTFGPRQPPLEQQLQILRGSPEPSPRSRAQDLPSRKSLTITVVCGNDLPLKLFSSAEPYVLIEVDGDVTGETLAVRGETSPRWDESFDVNVQSSSKVRFGVFNSQSPHKGDGGYLCGVCIIVKNLIDLDKSGQVTLTLDLHDNSWLFSYCGKLTIQLSW